MMNLESQIYDIFVEDKFSQYCMKLYKPKPKISSCLLLFAAKYNTNIILNNSFKTSLKWYCLKVAKSSKNYVKIKLVEIVILGKDFHSIKVLTKVGQFTCRLSKVCLKTIFMYLSYTQYCYEQTLYTTSERLSEESASNASFCERCKHEFKGVFTL